jgi:hypothetical protein
LLLTEQESVSVYLQLNGHFAAKPSTTIVFPVRPSGKDAGTSLSFLLTPADVNGDGRGDLIFSSITGEWKNRPPLERKFPPPDQK